MQFLPYLALLTPVFISFAAFRTIAFSHQLVLFVNSKYVFWLHKCPSKYPTRRPTTLHTCWTNNVKSPRRKNIMYYCDSKNCLPLELLLPLLPCHSMHQLSMEYKSCLCHSALNRHGRQNQCTECVQIITTHQMLLQPNQLMAWDAMLHPLSSSPGVCE